MAERKVDKVATRRDAAIYGLGPKPTPVDGEITGSKLPDKNQVIRCFKFVQNLPENHNRTMAAIACIVLEKIIPFYEKANIPMIAKKSAADKIKRLVTENNHLREIPKNRRTENQKVVEKMSQLKETFPLWPKNALDLIDHEEDRCFLMSMMTDRKATFGSKDVTLADKMKRVEARKDAEAARAEKSRAEITNLFDVVSFDDSIEGLGSDSDEDPPNYEPRPSTSAKKPKRKHRRLRDGTAAFIPHDVLSRRRLVSLATRLQMTPADQAQFTLALVEECLGDPSKLAISYSTADKARRTVSKTIVEDMKQHWVPPCYASIHWDSKAMKSLEGNFRKGVERVAIAVGDNDGVKLLGTPYYHHGTGEKTGDIIHDLVEDQLDEWNCRDNVINMVFDTTSSNTGHLSAACIGIQRAVSRHLFWSGCRHHIGELIVGHVFEDLKIEVSKSPDIHLFSRFQSNFDEITHAGDIELVTLNIEQFGVEEQQLIHDWRAETLVQIQFDKTFVRDDYKEFGSLVKIFLGDHEGQVKFLYPGALHRARWMAKVIYCLKIALLEKQIGLLPEGTITSRQQRPKIQRFCVFISVLYYQWWATCTTPVDAPWNDLQLAKSFISYEAIDKGIAKSAQTAFARHYWYLTAELVPLALFSSKTPPAERQRLADELLRVKPDDNTVLPVGRYGAEFGKPEFPGNLNLNTKLADLVTKDSWMIFRVLNLDDSFMSLPVQEWEDLDSYHLGLVRTKAINVTNDAAERFVKLSSDCIATGKTEEHYQNVLQVVEKNRKDNPNIRKIAKDQN